MTPPTPKPPRKNLSVFYVVPSGDNTEGSGKIGTYLRLGEYTDIERNTVEHCRENELYPDQHIDHEGCVNSVYANAAGGRQGIMMACDGRILVNAAERMYLEAGDCFHQRTKGDHRVDVDGDSVLVADKDLDMRSENGNVTISSANELNVNCDENYVTVEGESEHTYEKKHTVKYMKSIICEKHGRDKETVYGLKQSTCHGGILDSVNGLRVQADKFNLMSELVSFNWSCKQIDVKGPVMRKVTAKFGLTNCEAEWKDIMVGMQNVKADATRLETRRKDLYVKNIQAELENSSFGIKLTKAYSIL